MSDAMLVPMGETPPAIADMGSPDGKKSSAVLYKILAVLAFLFAVGGLFIGLLGKVNDDFAPMLLFPSEGKLSGSLLGSLIEVFKNTKEIFSLIPDLIKAGGMGILTLVHIALLYLLPVAVLVSLVLTIVALCSSKAARKCAQASLSISLIVYFGLLATVFHLGTVVVSGSAVNLKELIDFSLLLIVGALGLVLFILSIAHSKGLGVLNILLLLLPLAAFAGLIYPQEGVNGNTGLLLLAVPLTADAFKSFSTFELIEVLITALLCVLILINLLISLIRLTAKRAYALDVVRFILQLLVAAGLFLLLALKPIGGEEGEKAWTIFTQMPVILLLAATLAAFLLSLIVAIVRGAKKKHAAEELPVEAEPEMVPFEAPVIVPAEPVVAEPVVAEPAPEKSPMSEFERSMAQLAKGEAPAQDPLLGAQPYNPAYAQGYGYGYQSQYTYDPFINSLTPQEKNEFGDLFIAGKHGELKYLPTYVIGGDNTEFFRKVFIYLGRFRKNISSQLLDKLYAYVSSHS